MPITETLRTASELEAAGASHDLARLLAHKFEESAAAARQSTLDAFAAEMRLLRADLNVRFDKMDARFERIEVRLDKMDARFEQIEARLDKMDARFERIETRLDRVDGRFVQMEGRFEKMDSRLDTMEARLRAELQQSLRMSQAVVLSAIGLATAILAYLTHLWR